jgi:hypothetical protein
MSDNVVLLEVSLIPHYKLPALKLHTAEIYQQQFPLSFGFPGFLKTRSYFLALTYILPVLI